MPFLIETIIYRVDQPTQFQNVLQPTKDIISSDELKNIRGPLDRGERK